MDPEEHEWKDLEPVQEALKVVMEPEGGKELEVEGMLKVLQLKKKVLKDQSLSDYTRTGRNHVTDQSVQLAGNRPS